MKALWRKTLSAPPFRATSAPRPPNRLSVSEGAMAARVLEQRILDSPALPIAAASLAGLPADDPLAARWLVQLMAALLFFPPSDPAIEEPMVRRFVAPGFADTNGHARDSGRA